MSNWQTEKAEQNRKSFARLSKSLPVIFPAAVLARALGRPFIPPTPRIAIESYWRAHPIRADRLARAGSLWPSFRLDLAAQSKPQNWAAIDLPNAARSLPRASLQLRSGVLLRLRPGRLSTRLAQGPVGRWAK